MSSILDGGLPIRRDRDLGNFTEKKFLTHGFETKDGDALGSSRRRTPQKTTTFRQTQPRPTTTSSRLTSGQRNRLRQLLQERDADGTVPYGLDRYDNDEDMWRAYRAATKAAYRSHRKHDSGIKMKSEPNAGELKRSEGIGSRGEQPQYFSCFLRLGAE